MATLSIWETARSRSRYPVVRLDDYMVPQTVTFTGTPGLSNAFANTSAFVTVRATVDCAIRVGKAPTAVATDYPIPANQLVDIEIVPGDKISVIAT